MKQIALAASAVLCLNIYPALAADPVATYSCADRGTFSLVTKEVKCLGDWSLQLHSTNVQSSPILKRGMSFEDARATLDAHNFASVANELNAELRIDGFAFRFAEGRLLSFVGAR